MLLVNHVGYEILLPAVVMETFHTKEIGDAASLYIYYQQSERQPKPTLIGFNLEVEKEFFQYFISVEAIGPLKAAKALTLPVREIASAIESRDARKLSQLKGIGQRTAQKIIATLEGKMDKFALIRKTDAATNHGVDDVASQVLDVLVNQLGHRAIDAKRMIADALKHQPAIDSPEALIEEVYRGQKQTT